MAQQQKVSGVVGHGGAPLQSPRRKPNSKGVGEEATSDTAASVGRCCFPSCLCHGVGSMLLCSGPPIGTLLGSQTPESDARQWWPGSDGPCLGSLVYYQASH